MRRDLASERMKRKMRTFEAVKNNPGIPLEKLYALLSMQLQVSAKKVEEYVRELHNAGWIHVDFGKAWDAEYFTKLAPDQEEMR